MQRAGYTLSVLVCAVLAAAPTLAQKPKVFDVKALFGKDFDGYNWVLGKPRGIVREPKFGETRTYLAPIEEISKLFVSQKVNSKAPDQIQVLFKAEKVNDWKAALKLVGFNGDYAQEKALPAEPGKKGAPTVVEILGVPKTKAIFHWVGTDPEFKAPILTIILPAK